MSTTLQPIVALPPRRSVGRDAVAAVLLVALAAALRWRRLSQSLWFDEMTTLLDFVRQPWSKVLAGGAGQYVPNNHVLHTILVKLIYPAGAPGVHELILRVPSWTAGSLLPVALAWPLRRRSPWTAVAVGLIAAVHPWLVALGSEARGYSVLMLLGIVATNLLPTGRSTRRRATGYIASLAGAIYTVPLAALLVPAHGVAVLAADRAAFRQWIIWAIGGVAIATALYIPMETGLADYYGHPYPATMTYRYFIDALPRNALAGQYMPAGPVDPTASILPADTAPVLNAACWLIPVLTIVAGSFFGWRQFPDARPLLASLGTITALAAALPLAVPGATEVRFDTWAAPLFCLSAGLLLSVAGHLRFGGGAKMSFRVAASAGLAGLLAVMVRWDVRQLPNQPIREAVAVADRLAPAGTTVVVLYIGADETVACYSDAAAHHPLRPAYDAGTFRDLLAAPGKQRPWVVVIFEQLARDRAESGDADAADCWHELTAHYIPAARLPGRIVPVAIYQPRD